MMGPTENSSKTLRRYETNKSDVSLPFLNETMEKYIEEADHPNEDSLMMKKIAVDPSFKEDLDKLLSQLNKVKAQREQYKVMFQQILNKYEAIEGLKPSFEKFLNDYVKENECEDSKSLDQQYGKDIAGYLDKLNVQIDFLRMKILEENSISNINIKEEAEYLPETSKEFSQNFFEEINRRKIEMTNISSQDLAFKKKIRPKWISVDYHLKKGEGFEELVDISRKSLEEIQDKLGYFPQRIKELEEENTKMFRMIKKFNELHSTGTLKEIEERMKTNEQMKQEMEKNMSELSLKQKEIEEKANQLEKKRLELEMKEKELLDKEKNVKIPAKNETADPRNSFKVVHYNQASVASSTGNEKSPNRISKSARLISDKDPKANGSLPVCSGCIIN